MTRRSLLLAISVALFLLVVPPTALSQQFQPDLGVTTTISAAGHANSAVAPSARPGTSLIPIHPDAARRLKEQGRSFKYPFPNNVNEGNKFDPGGTAIGQLTTAADQKIIVLFVSFSNNPPGGPNTRVDLSNFDSLLFGTEYKPAYWESIKTNYGIDYPTDRTLYNYYQAVSYGAVKVGTYDLPSTVGWIQLENPYEYYFGDHCNGFCADPPHDVYGLAIDVLNIAKTKLDFSKYANPTTHVIPNIFIVVAGTGAEWTGTPDLMWSHSSSLRWLTGGNGLPVGTDADGNTVYANRYAMMPEVGGDLTGYLGSVAGPYPATVGVYAHEYGHVLGLPDQYDYGYQSEGTGQYSLMAGGSWGLYPRYNDYSGNSPSFLDAWSRYRLGFLTPTVLTAGASLTLRPAESFTDVYRVDVPNSGGKEYYLLENRQQIGFDQTLWRCAGKSAAYIEQCAEKGGLSDGAHGLAIYHIDNVGLTAAYSRPNEAENWKEFRSEGWRKASNGLTHYSISLIQADDQWSLEHGANQGDRGDLYPGYFNITSFGTYTFPNSSSYYFWGGSFPKFGYSSVNVTNIQETTASDQDCPQCIKLDFSFLPWMPPGF